MNYLNTQIVEHMTMFRILRNIVPIETDDGMTDITEDELKQRDDDEKNLQEALRQIELDKLLKRKLRVKK